MKIAITYPPLNSKKGTPLLSQNRQFQWFNSPTYIYPVVPAYAATMVRQAGHQVLWLDGIAEKLSWQQWFARLKKFQPDLVMIESKTPVIRQHWQIINRIKNQWPKWVERSKEKKSGGVPPKIVLVGDHVTALPEESMQNSPVDFVLTGGDYDFLLLNLVEYLSEEGKDAKKGATTGAKKSIKKGARKKLAAGIWYRNIKDRSQGNSQLNCRRGQDKKQPYGSFKNTGRFKLNHNLKKLPLIDRQLTQWQLYAYNNGNYKYKPGAYIMAGRDCWWRRKGGCSFCSWTTLYPQHRVRTVSAVMAEIRQLIEQQQVKEIMDDSGTFPVGNWLREFCRELIKVQKKWQKTRDQKLRGRNHRPASNFNCNLRFGALRKQDYKLMAKAGFRMLLFGLESANQTTLDRLNKGIKIANVKKELQIIQEVNRQIKGAQLEPHLTFMIGYPWETREDALKTINFVKQLFANGLLDSLQATVMIPYPGTRLFAKAKKQGWLKTTNWNHYDMKRAVLKSPLSDKEIFVLTRGLYTSFLTPKFIWKKITSIRSLDDIKFFTTAARKVVGHLGNFN